MDNNTSFTIGKVTGVHGLGGNLKVWSFAESIDTFSPGRIVLLKFENEEGKTFSIKRAAVHKKGILLTLDGIDSRDLAEEQIGKEILIDRDQLPEPPDDTWYWQDLIGLDVIDDAKGFIGRITQLFSTDAHDILVVKDPGGDTPDSETLIPMLKQFVTAVDQDLKRVMVKLPEEE